MIKRNGELALGLTVLSTILILLGLVAGRQAVLNQRSNTSSANLSKLSASENMKVGSILFPWYFCPPDDNSCIPERWKYHPPGTSAAYPNGGNYNPTDLSWWKVETSDMTCSGLDIAFVYTWESEYITNITRLTTAIDSQGSPLKIAQYWDSSYASGDGGPVDLSDPNTAKYRYEKFIKPFYQTIPSRLWAYESGKPILAVYRYGSDKYTHPEKAADFFKNIKSYFKNDFGTEPFLILGHVWTWGASNAKEAADAINEAFSSATCDNGNAKIQTINNYTTTTIAAGAWDDNNSGGCHLERNDDGILKKGFNQIPENNNILMIESWNELGEGSGIERATDYPKNGGGNLPPAYYLDSLRSLLNREDR